MVKEKSNLVAETLDLRTSLSKAKERTDQEYALRLQMESSVEALKRYMCAHLFVFVHVYPCSVCTRIRVCACVCSYLNSLLSPSAPSYNSARLISLSSPLLFSRASNETRMLTMDSSEREGRTEQLYAQVSEYVCVWESECVCMCVLQCAVLHTHTPLPLPLFSPLSPPLSRNLTYISYTSHTQGEEEKKTLRSSLVALQNAYDEKERARLSEVALRQRADADLTKYKVGGWFASVFPQIIINTLSFISHDINQLFTILFVSHCVHSSPFFCSFPIPPSSFLSRVWWIKRTTICQTALREPRQVNAVFLGFLF